MPAHTRPQLHLTADSGWVNDPYGLTWHDGRYHQFFQYVPDQTQWAPSCCWGHATSPDLLHWTEQPVVLAPDDQDGGCWSGSVVVPDSGPATMFYTAVDASAPDIGRVRVAHPAGDDWSVWTKGDVVASIPEGMDAVAFRDPFVFRDGDRWRMVLSAALADGTALAPAYSSTDLRDWPYDGPLASRHRGQTEPVWTGAGWECAQFFPLGDRWVLVVSVWEPDQLHHESYAVGDVVEGVFVPRAWGRLTHGPSYYAGSTFLDREGRRGLVHWMRGVDDTDGRWAGAHSIPHLLRLDGDVLVADPHPSVTSTRGPGRRVTPGDRAAVPTVVDIEWGLEEWADEASLTIRAEGGAVLDLHVSGGRLMVSTGEHDGEMPLVGNRIRILLDGPAAEIFTDGGTYGLPVTSAPGLWVETAGSGRVVIFALLP